MTRNGTAQHLASRALRTIAAVLALLGATGAGAQELDPNDRYSLAGAAIAPKVAQSLTWGIADAVSSRVDAVGSVHATMERLEAAAVRPYGLPKLTHRMLIGYDGSPLLAGGQGEVNGAHGTLWGFGITAGGDYRQLGSGDGAAVAWEGGVVSGHLGVDVRPIREMLAGLTVGVSQTNTRFEAAGGKGALGHRMVTASPYVSWVLFPGLWWWATATYGIGEVAIADGHETGADAPHGGSSSLASGAVGFTAHVIDSRGLEAGSRVGMAVKGAGSIGEFALRGTRGGMPDLTMTTWRGRILLQGTYEKPLSDVTWLIPTLEAGMRYDGGRAASGAGVELGGRLRFEDQSVGFTLDAHGRALVPLEDASQEWTAGGLVRISSDRDGYGPFLHVTPRLEKVESIAAAPASRRGRVDTELGYGGLRVDGVPGLLTPYGAVTLADGGTSTWRWGSRLALTDDVDLNLEAQHDRAHVAAATEHSATFSANLRL